MRVDIDSCPNNDVTEVERPRYSRYHDRQTERSTLVGTSEVDLAASRSTGSSPAPHPSSASRPDSPSRMPLRQLPLPDPSALPFNARSSPQSSTGSPRASPSTLGHRQVQATDLLFAVLARQLQHERAVTARLIGRGTRREGRREPRGRTRTTSSTLAAPTRRNLAPSAQATRC